MTEIKTYLKLDNTEINSIEALSAFLMNNHSRSHTIEIIEPLVNFKNYNSQTVYKLTPETIITRLPTNEPYKKEDQSLDYEFIKWEFVGKLIEISRKNIEFAFLDYPVPKVIRLGTIDRESGIRVPIQKIVTYQDNSGVITLGLEVTNLKLDDGTEASREL